MKNKEWVQCFFSINFNYMYESGQSKFAWGFGWFKLKGDNTPLTDQIIDLVGEVEGKKLTREKVFNLNVRSFTPFPGSVFECNPNIEDEEQC